MARSRPAFQRTPIIPQRVRSTGGRGFAFVPHRFLREGFFASLLTDELLLYLLLVLTADRHGLSFYHADTLCSLLQLPHHRYLHARNSLIDKDLIAFDGTRFQVLSLPEQPLHRPVPPLRGKQDMESHDPATIRKLIRQSLANE